LAVGAALGVVEAVNRPGGAGMAAEGELGGAEAGGGDALDARTEEVEVVDVAGGDGEGADGLFVEDFALGHVAGDGDESGVGIHGDAVGGGADFQDDVDAGLLADGEADAGLLVIGEAGGVGFEFVLTDLEEGEAEVALLDSLNRLFRRWC